MSAVHPRRIFTLLVGTACAAILAGPVLAGPANHNACMRPGLLSISGHGESRIAPDQALVTLGVTTQADTAAQAMKDNTTRQQAVLDVLNQAGIEKNNIQTSGLTLNPLMNYPKDGGSPTIEGYSAQNLLTIRVTDITQTGEVLDSIVSAGANELQGISFIRDDAAATQDAALQRAVENATHRAEVMAKAAGIELGSIVRIGEPQISEISPRPMAMRALQSAPAGKSVPVEGGEVAFTTDVNVAFTINGEGGTSCDTTDVPALSQSPTQTGDSEEN